MIGKLPLKSIKIDFPSPKKTFWRVLPPNEASKHCGTGKIFYRAIDLDDHNYELEKLGDECKKLSIDLFLHVFGDPTILYLIEPTSPFPGWYKAISTATDPAIFLITDGKTTIEWGFELSDKELFTLYDFYDRWSTGYLSWERIESGKGYAFFDVKTREPSEWVKKMQDLIIWLLDDLIVKYKAEKGIR